MPARPFLETVIGTRCATLGIPASPGKGTIVSPLFSDYSVKYRFLYLPPGKRITWHDTDRWEFPVGAVLIKTFSYPVDARTPSLGRRQETAL